MTRLRTSPGGLVARFDVVIVTRAAGQYHDARQLVAAAKENPRR